MKRLPVVQFLLALSQTPVAIRYALDAVEKHQAKVDPLNLVEDSEDLFEAFEGVMSANTRASLSTAFANLSVKAAPARAILLNNGLVLLCSQLEQFFVNLIDTILAADPRRLKQFASKKCLTTSELVELGDYESIMQRLREKVCREVTDSGICSIFVDHFKKKFGIFDETDLNPKETSRGWDLEKLNEIFNNRNRIVHHGDFEVSGYEYISEVSRFFGAIETLLTLNAVRQHEVELEPPDSLPFLILLGKVAYCVCPSSVAVLTYRRPWQKHT